MKSVIQSYKIMLLRFGDLMVQRKPKNRLKGEKRQRAAEKEETSDTEII